MHGSRGSTLPNDVTQTSVFQTLSACKCWSVGSCVLCLTSGKRGAGGQKDERQTCRVDILRCMYEVIWYEWFGDVMLVVDRSAEAAWPH